MFSLLSTFLLAQTTPALPNSTVPPMTSQEVVVPQEMRSLPGQLDDVLVFNSNSPELVLEEGILLSTLPPQGKKFPAAHLNVPLQGRFDVFAHHIAKAKTPDDLRTLYLGIVLYNPGRQSVTVDVLQAASYLSQPDAPFIDLAAVVDNPRGAIFAGPGSRATDEVLRGRRQGDFPAQVVIPPGESRLLLNVPIPVKTLTPPLNGRSTVMRLRSTGLVYAASLARFATQKTDGSEVAPTLEEWQTLLETGNLAQPRDRTPTPLDQTKGQMIYGRVAGVARGSRWVAQLVDPAVDPTRATESTPQSWTLAIPQPGQAFAYGLSTLLRGTLGTEQIQSAPMVARYPDTAYQAHGNYAIEYDLTLPLQNTTDQPQTVTIALQTPIKDDQPKKGLRFLEPPGKQIFFRGTVRLRYNDDRGLPQTRYVHLVQRRGQQGEPLLVMKLGRGDRRLVQVTFLYPPDSTPPQILTVRTLLAEQTSQ